MIAAKSTAQAIPALRRLAAAYRQDHANWSPAADIAYNAAASALRSDLESNARSSLAELTNLFRSRFGNVDLATFVEGPDFDTNYARLSDALVTNAILGDDGAVAAADAGALLQIKAILQQLAVSDQTLADDGAIHEALTRTLLLPGGIFPLLGQSGPTAESSAEREDSSLKAGLSVSGSYGPIVEFKATTDFATSTAKEEASKVGTKYSKDVTTRATSKIIEKNRRQVVTRFVTKVSEKSVHGFGNVKGDASIPTGRASPSSERRSIRDCAKRRGQAAHRWSRHVHAPCRRRRARGRSAATKASSMRPTSSSRPAPFIRR